MTEENMSYALFTDRVLYRLPYVQTVTLHLLGCHDYLYVSLRASTFVVRSLPIRHGTVATVRRRPICCPASALGARPFSDPDRTVGLSLQHSIHWFSASMVVVRCVVRQRNWSLAVTAAGGLSLTKLSSCM